MGKVCIDEQKKKRIIIVIKDDVLLWKFELIYLFIRCVLFFIIFLVSDINTIYLFLMFFI